MAGVTKTAARERAAAAGDLDAAARLRARKPAEKTLILAEDETLGADLEAAIQADRAARFGADEATRTAAAERLAAAREAVSQDAIMIRLRSIGRSGYAKLQADHPPTEADHKEVQRTTGNTSAKARWDRSFAADLIAACMVDPAGVTADELTEMLDDGRISDGEMTALFGAAIELHEGSRVADLGK